MQPFSRAESSAVGQEGISDKSDSALRCGIDMCLALGPPVSYFAALFFSRLHDTFFFIQIGFEIHTHTHTKVTINLVTQQASTEHRLSLMMIYDV